MDWLTGLIERILALIPRPMIITPDEMGVRCTPCLIRGIIVKELGPGWWWDWPISRKLEVISVKTQVVDLRPQSVWTIDGKELVISGSIKYRVDSAAKALLDVSDYDENICTLALGIIFDFISTHTLAELKFPQLKEEILKGLREASRGWGLKIETIYLTDIGRVRNIRLLMNESFNKLPR